MKCDKCKFQEGYTLSQEEVGGGSILIYCVKGYWNDTGPLSEEGEKLWENDISWDKCKCFETRCC